MITVGDYVTYHGSKEDRHGEYVVLVVHEPFFLSGTRYWLRKVGATPQQNTDDTDLSLVRSGSVTLIEPL